MHKYLEFQIMPICLFGVDHKNFEFGYVAGFGSTNFATNCWTTKEGPNPFEQCQPEFKKGDKKYSVSRVFVGTYMYHKF